MQHARKTWGIWVLASGVLLAAPFWSSAVTQDEIHWQDIGQVCGHVSSTMPTKKTIRTVDGKVEVREYATTINLAHLTLYRTENQSSQCCAQAILFGENTSGRHGEFGFTGFPAGYYWLVVHLKDRDVNVPIRTEKYDKSRCEDKSVRRIIFVDAVPSPKVEVHIL